MKNILSFVLILLPFILFSQAKLNWDPSEWQLVWGDEFDTYQTGDDVLSPHGPYVPDLPRCGQHNLIDEDNIGIDANNGYLVLKATRIPNAPVYQSGIGCSSEPFFYYGSGIKLNLPVFPANDVNEDGVHDYVDNCPAFPYAVDPSPNFYYGMYEIRCKLPVEERVWPAFWLWNPHEEFDIMEYFGRPHEMTGSFNDWTTNNSLNWPLQLDENGNPWVRSCKTTHEFDRNLTDEWHTFHMTWTPNKVSYFMDGVELRTETRSNHSGCPVRLTINLFAACGNDNCTDSTYPSAEFLVDYVRVYNKASWDPSDDTTWDSDYMEAYVPDNLGTAKCNEEKKSLAVGIDNKVFFRTDFDEMGYYYFTNPNQPGLSQTVYHTLDNIATPLGPYGIIAPVEGDVVVGGGVNHVYYRGVLGILAVYYWDTTLGAWVNRWFSRAGEKDPINIHPDCGSLAINEDESNSLFYRGVDDQLYFVTVNLSNNSYALENAHQLAGIQNSSSRKVDGDIVVGLNNKAFYRGKDGLIHSLHKDANGNWHHNLVDWTSAGQPVASTCGALAISTDGGINHLFYQNMNTTIMNHFFWNPNHPDALGNGWIHEELPFDLGLQKVNGRISTGKNLNVYYTGTDDLTQMYRYYSDHWYHNWVRDHLPTLNNGGYVVDFTLEKSQGALDVGKEGDRDIIFFNDFITNKLNYYYISDNTGDLVDLPCGSVNNMHHLRDITTSRVEYENSYEAPVFLTSRVDKNKIVVYPNPTKGVFSVLLDDSVYKSLSLTDALGKTVLIRDIEGASSLDLDISNFSNGLYIVQIRTRSGEVISKKLIIE